MKTRMVAVLAEMTRTHMMTETDISRAIARGDIMSTIALARTMSVRGVAEPHSRRVAGYASDGEARIREMHRRKAPIAAMAAEMIDAAAIAAIETIVTTTVITIARADTVSTVVHAAAMNDDMAARMSNRREEISACDGAARRDLLRTRSRQALEATANGRFKPDLHPKIGNPQPTLSMKS